MDKIRVLYVQEKRIKEKDKAMTIGGVIDSMVPDTYEMDYIGIKENILKKVEAFKPHIIHISQSPKVDILEMVNNIRKTFPSIVIFVSISDHVSNQQEVILQLKDAGVYKCYGFTLVIENLIHDMFVALNME